jgi:hypothetical protein
MRAPSERPQRVASILPPQFLRRTLPAATSGRAAAGSMGKSALRISLPLIMSGRTVTDGEPLCEWPLFVYNFDLFVDYLPGKPIDRHMHPVTLLALDNEFF